MRLHGVLVRAGMVDEDHYGIFGVASTATPLEIRHAYRAAARRAHPDKGGDEERFHKVARAFAVLSCPTARSLYDRQCALNVGLCYSVPLRVDTVPAGTPISASSAAPLCMRVARGACRLRTAEKRVGPSRRVDDALRQLHSILRDLDALRRFVVLKNMMPHSRAALLEFMEKSHPAAATTLGSEGCGQAAPPLHMPPPRPGCTGRSPAARAVRRLERALAAQVRAEARGRALARAKRKAAMTKKAAQVIAAKEKARGKALKEKARDARRKKARRLLERKGRRDTSRKDQAHQKLNRKVGASQKTGERIAQKKRNSCEEAL